MKIAQIVCVYPPYGGGIGRVAADYSQILQRQGHEVKVFIPVNSQKENAMNPAVIRLKPWLKFGHGAFIPQLFCKLKSFDIIYLHYPFFGGAEIVWLTKLLRGKNPRLFIHYHMDVFGLPGPAKILSWPSTLTRNSLFKKAELVTCASLDYVKNSQISRLYRSYPEKFIEIPFGVETDKFFPAASVKRTGCPRILFVGGLDRAHYFKGVNILLRALSELKSKNWQLDIVGRGDLKPAYQRQATAMGIADKVKFLDKVSNRELPKIYRQADLLVLPSINKNEAFGLVLLEAMASGLPVIASALPGVRRVFKDGIQGLLARPGDKNDLREKIMYLLNNGELKKRMGLAGRKLVKKQYDQKLIQAKIKNIFQ